MLESCWSIINIDCVDPLGHTALLMAINNENMEIVDLLLENKVGIIIAFWLPDFCALSVLFCTQGGISLYSFNITKASLGFSD